MVLHFRAEQLGEAALAVLPVSFCFLFVGWYIFRVVRYMQGKKQYMWSIWNEYDHRTLVRSLLLPPDEFKPTRPPPRRWWMKLFRLATKDMTASFKHFRYCHRVFVGMDLRIMLQSR